MKWEKVVASTLVLNMLAFAPMSAFAYGSGGVSAMTEQTPQKLLPHSRILCCQAIMHYQTN
ncbi:hypothetical protein EDM56_00235 [Brevibacillus fluminis]|uniref:Uncharacterized protein n=1 Tax=Brevibacillus fluminis TaxID=511487 RepID=A0A3M8DXF9_9BACL|nr:hypothetical protein [Brevibacillus fluminis]RNB92614.1 hypothetical protein EDM56_00235 [Brevibacillus fluminis]